MTRAVPELSHERWRRVMPAATSLVWAVRCGDMDEVERALDEVIMTSGAGLRLLVLALAAMVPDDEPPTRLLGWLDNPAGYLRLREEGLSRTDALDALQLKLSSG